MDTQVQADAEIDKISQEMVRGLNGEDSSLLMLPTYLTVASQVEEDRPVIVLDAGGTNLRIAVITIKNGRVNEKCFSVYPMPGTYGLLKKNEFFDEIAEKIAPLSDQSDIISFCFSYIAEPLPDHDAVLHALCKEVSVEGIEGVKVCYELSEALKRCGVSQKFSFYLLNDSVASLLGGIPEVPSDRTYTGSIGLIWGTGFNICYSEKTSNIKKLSAPQMDHMVINTEVGRYTGFAQGEIDVVLDQNSMIPGDHQTEKMIGGAYLGDLICHAIRAATETGLLSKSFSGMAKLELYDVDAFLRHGAGIETQACTEEDLKTLREIICAVYRRAAKIVACMLVAVGVQIRGDQAYARIPVITDGSTLLKSEYLMHSLLGYCDELSKGRGITLDIIPASGSTLKGTAYAALLNSAGYSG